LCAGRFGHKKHSGREAGVAHNKKKTRCTFGAFGDKTHRGKGGRWNMQQKKRYAFGAMDTKNKEEGG
jgi:hypothetical protein